VAREYARIRISIAGDADFENLSPAGQWFYTRILLPEPTMNHCGVTDWRPRRLLGKARGLNLDYVMAAASDCERGRFALFDVDTEEALARAYIRTEELLRNPKMAVAVIGSYRAIASKTLRAAVVSEIRRAHSEHSEYSSWKAGDVGQQLTEIMDQPASDQVPYVDTITNPIGNHISNGKPVPIGNAAEVPITEVVPGADYQSDSVPIPCISFPAASSMQLKEGGYVSPEGHQSADPDPNDPPPPMPQAHQPQRRSAVPRLRGAPQGREAWDAEQPSASPSSAPRSGPRSAPAPTAMSAATSKPAAISSTSVRTTTGG
jgi:hypothetical protein